jgi:hypothetical protein
VICYFENNPQTTKNYEQLDPNLVLDFPLVFAQIHITNENISTIYYIEPLINKNMTEIKTMSMIKFRTNIHPFTDVSSFTLSFWVKPSTLNGNQDLVGQNRQSLAQDRAGLNLQSIDSEAEITNRVQIEAQAQLKNIHEVVEEVQGRLDQFERDHFRFLQIGRAQRYDDAFALVEDDASADNWQMIDASFVRMGLGGADTTAAATTGEAPSRFIGNWKDASTKDVLVLTWRAPAGDVTGYKVEVAPNGGAWQEVSQIPATQLSFEITKTSDSKYTSFRVSAVYSDGSVGVATPFGFAGQYE